jgi:hypothetical protein
MPQLDVGELHACVVDVRAVRKAADERAQGGLRVVPGFDVDLRLIQQEGRVVLDFSVSGRLG